MLVTHFCVSKYNQILVWFSIIHLLLYLQTVLCNRCCVYISYATSNSWWRWTTAYCWNWLKYTGKYCHCYCNSLAMFTQMWNSQCDANYTRIWMKCLVSVSGFMQIVLLKTSSVAAATCSKWCCPNMFLCLIWPYGDGVGNMIEENSSIFSLSWIC